MLRQVRVTITYKVGQIATYTLTTFMSSIS